MPRPLRVQAAGIRHVVCRGNRRQAIFLDDDDRESYLGRLGDVCRRLAWRVLAWCLMTNHVHLVLSVGDDTISDGMQLLNGWYGQEFNFRHGYTGHLFQGRFRAELVEDNPYGLTVVRYVDLNPERARAAHRAEHWRHSSLRAFLGLEPPRPFHDLTWTLEQFARDPAVARRRYAEFVAAGRALPRSGLPPVPAGHGRGLTPDMWRRAMAPGPVRPRPK